MDHYRVFNTNGECQIVASYRAVLAIAKTWIDQGLGPVQVYKWTERIEWF